MDHNDWPIVGMAHNDYDSYIIFNCYALYEDHLKNIRPKKINSCVQVSEVEKIRVGRSKNIFILDFFLLQMYRGCNRRQGSGGQLL